MSKNSKVVRAPKRQRGENGNVKARAGGMKRRSGGGGEKAYWDKMGAQFEVSSDEDKDEWSSSEEEAEEVTGDGVNYMRISGDEPSEQDTASAIVRRWKQAQQQKEKSQEEESTSGEKRKIEAVVAEDEDDGEDDDELPETDEFVNVNGDEKGEEVAKGEGAEEEEGEDEADMDAEDEAPRVRKGPGSVSFALVLGKLLSPDGQPAPQAAQDEAEETTQPAVADPILMNFKKRTNKKLLAEKRRRREARELALKKKLLKARDHRIPTVLSEPAEVRLRKLATKGVVQLFNVVRKQQKEMAMQNVEELEKKNPLQAEKMTKTKFLELLQKTGGARKVEVKKEQVKSEEAIKQEAKPAWDVLSDDYMLGASLKDLPDEDGDE